MKIILLTGSIVEGGIAEQTEQVMQNIKAVAVSALPRGVAVEIEIIAEM
jgi:enamine deaminase RidA (YjgF/YER057c/UK114 family)